MKIVSVEQMRQLDRRAESESGVPTEVLMENAGLAVAASVRTSRHTVTGCSVLVLVGPGNNGGDGLVAARHLADWGAKVCLYLFNRKTGGDRNFSRAVDQAIPWVDATADNGLLLLDKHLSATDIVIDAILGTGRLRPLDGVVGQVLERVRAAKEARPALAIVAVDVPSGLDADTGAVDPKCLTADVTVTLGYPKIGLFRFPAASKVGSLEIADIGIPPYLAASIPTELITAAIARSLLPARPPDANKGTFGRLLVVAGSINYVGAAYLACEGAMRVGVGLVTLATPGSLQPMLAGRLTETTYIPLPEVERGVIGPDALPPVRDLLHDCDALLLGCGLGQHPATAEFVDALLLSGDHSCPVIVDADGLNLLAKIPQWWQRLRTRAVLTPHPGEMSRLTAASTTEIQKDRLASALGAAAKWGQIVVLKGAHTVVASPDGHARLSGVANAGLASAGTGDVLAGAIGGMLGQGLSPFDAATCGVYLHAAAGVMVQAELGNTGMLASDLLPRLPLAIRQLRLGSQHRDSVP